VQTFFTISGMFAQDFLKETDLMEINLSMAIIYASQSTVDVRLAERGFDLVLVVTIRNVD